MIAATDPDVLTAARIIMDSQPHELRVVLPQEPRPIVSSGVFLTANELAKAAAKYDSYSHVYIGLNPTTLSPHPVRRGEAVKDDQISRVR